LVTVVGQISMGAQITCNVPCRVSPPTQCDIKTVQTSKGKSNSKLATVRMRIERGLLSPRRGFQKYLARQSAECGARAVRARRAKSRGPPQDKGPPRAGDWLRGATPRRGGKRKNWQRRHVKLKPPLLPRIVPGRQHSKHSCLPSTSRAPIRATCGDFRPPSFRGCGASTWLAAHAASGYPARTCQRAVWHGNSGHEFANIRIWTAHRGISTRRA
jgi:hypothetical protein